MIEEDARDRWRTLLVVNHRVRAHARGARQWRKGFVNILRRLETEREKAKDRDLERCYDFLIEEMSAPISPRGSR